MVWQKRESVKRRAKLLTVIKLQMTAMIEKDADILRNSGLFDESWYLESYPDVASLKMDPVHHYLWLGARIGRDPSQSFSTRKYLQLNPDVAAAKVNPLLHYVEEGMKEGRQIGSAASLSTWTPPQVKYVERLNFTPLTNALVRMVAFYLPQFHPIKENNEWWGEGFTEWTNVCPTQSQFIGHYQPHIPHTDIGYYDLREITVQKKQIELAKSYGVEGFCFYYYWFKGQRLLERPIENYLNNPDLDHPFCLCWANENWSRRWDGLESEILMAQDHSPEDDLNCIADLARYMRDPRYIRIGGKPLIVIYRPSLLPSIRETAERWRGWCRENGIGEIYLAYTQSFEKNDPRDYGFDAAIEFPPNNSSPPDITDRVAPLSGDYQGKVYDWRVFVERSQNYPNPGYQIFRSVCPGWDNTARRKTGGTVFANNTPTLYQNWLENAVADTIGRISDPDERLVFVNAWNEWAEGAHLEPDEATGYAYLAATRNALLNQQVEVSPKKRRKIVIVSHDAYRHGAQFLALNLARVCSQDFGYDVHIVMLGDGPLKSEFAKLATLHDLTGIDPRGREAQELARSLRSLGAGFAICNTTVSGSFVPTLKDAGFKIVSLIHELPEAIRQYRLEDSVRSIAEIADLVVFPAQLVADGFGQFSTVDPARRTINPQGLYKTNPLGRKPADIAAARIKLRERFGIAPNAPIVLGVGYSDKRKGIDLFIEAGVKLLDRLPGARFIWLGADAEPDWMTYAKSSAAEASVLDRFIFPGFDEDTDCYYAGADVFALSSREDPFPSVVLYAMDCGLPVVAFSGTGGMAELIEAAGGLNVGAFDVAAYAEALHRAIEDSQLRAQAASQGPEIIDRQFTFRRYVHDLLSHDVVPLERVSVVVPNYNYARYIADRLNTIRDQDFPVYELIILDDNSSDDSLERIREAIADFRIPTVVVVNQENSGSVFKQWQLGAKMARGDFVWIAEADDLADPEFLDGVMPALREPGVVMSYCQSRQIDGDGLVVSDDYLEYVADIDPERWTKAYVANDLEDIRSGLFLKNTIPNVSAAVFRREPLLDTLEQHAKEITSFRNAGDWVTYIRLNERGGIAFCPLSLNSHRRHQSSVTIGNSNQLHLDEIVKVQTETIARHNLGHEATAQAEAYARRIAVQFGLGGWP